MRVVQIVPELTTGSGVEAVAYHLEKEWQRLGVTTARFTLDDAAGGWLPRPGAGLMGKLALAGRVLWFSTIGTVLARHALRNFPRDTVTICHNDVLFGDVYVNHGVLAEAMRARGHLARRMVRNPLHLFTWVRDTARFANSVHGVVVNLTTPEEQALRRAYPRVRPRSVVIGNGVDVERYRPDQDERGRVRREMGFADDHIVALFVGHEFERKGLPTVLRALRGTPDHLHLIVVGGTADMVNRGEEEAASLGIGARVRFVGRQADPRPYLHAADLLVFPSAYESYGLVVLEALACGLPVCATAVGCVPDVIVEGINGHVVAGDAASVRDGMLRLARGDRVRMADAARATAERHTWREVAKQYLRVFDEIVAARS